MALENLRDQLREQMNEAWAKIQETSAYNTLRERYESQTPEAQKGIVAGAIAVGVLIVLSLPMSYISSSSDSLAAFEENRELIFGLLKAARSAKDPAPLPPPTTPDQLRSQIENLLRNNGIIQDQRGEMQDIPEDLLKRGLPPGVVPTGLAVQIKKLNLTQVLEIGNMIQGMSPGTKLLGLDIVQSAGQTHYYDIMARVVSYGIPSFEDSEPEAPPARGGSRRPPPRREDTDSEEDQ